MTAAAGIGAIKDKDYFVNNCKQIIKNRAYVTEELENLGFELLDSKTNFVFAKHPKMSGSELYLELRNRGILVRHFNKERISDFLRITIGSEDEMRELILELTEILEK